MKKLRWLLTLGSSILPLTAIVSCNTTKKEVEKPSENPSKEVKEKEVEKPKTIPVSNAKHFRSYQVGDKINEYTVSATTFLPTEDGGIVYHLAYLKNAYYLVKDKNEQDALLELDKNNKILNVYRIGDVINLNINDIDIDQVEKYNMDEFEVRYFGGTHTEGYKKELNVYYGVKKEEVLEWLSRLNEEIIFNQTDAYRKLHQAFPELRWVITGFEANRLNWVINGYNTVNGKLTKEQEDFLKKAEKMSKNLE